MELTYSAEYEAFRKELQRFLAANWPLKGDEAKLSPGKQALVFRARAIAAGYLARNVPREFEVFYQVTFTLHVEGERMLEPELLTVARSYTYDGTQVLAKAREEEELRRALPDDLARRVVRRIEAAGAAVVAPGT